MTCCPLFVLLWTVSEHFVLSAGLVGLNFTLVIWMTLSLVSSIVCSIPPRNLCMPFGYVQVSSCLVVPLANLYALCCSLPEQCL